MRQDQLATARRIVNHLRGSTSDTSGRTEFIVSVAGYLCAHCHTPLADRGDGDECPGCVEKARGE